MFPLLKSRSARKVFENLNDYKNNVVLKSPCAVFITNVKNSTFDWSSSSLIQLTIENCQDVQLCISKIITDVHVVNCQNVSIKFAAKCNLVVDKSFHTTCQLSVDDCSIFSTDSSLEIHHNGNIVDLKRVSGFRQKTFIVDSRLITKSCNEYGDLVT